MYASVPLYMFQCALLLPKRFLFQVQSVGNKNIEFSSSVSFAGVGVAADWILVLIALV